MKLFYISLLSLFIITPAYGVLFPRSDMQKSLQVSPIAHALYRQKLRDAHLKSRDIMELLTIASYAEKPAPKWTAPLAYLKYWWRNDNALIEKYKRYKTDIQTQEETSAFLRRNIQWTFDKIKSTFYLSSARETITTLRNLITLSSQVNPNSPILDIYQAFKDDVVFKHHALPITKCTEVQNKLKKASDEPLKINDALLHNTFNLSDLIYIKKDYFFISPVCRQKINAQLYKDAASYTKSTTANHIMSLPWKLCFGLFNSEAYKIFNGVAQTEEDLNSLGYYTFVHGQRWKHQLSSNWYTQLWHAIHNKKNHNFIFAHVSPTTTNANLLEEEALRKTITANGGQFGRELFMNAGLFYNDSNIGSTTAAYFTLGYNINNKTQTPEGIFSTLNLTPIYEKHKTELQKLEVEHANLTNVGNLLLIAIPKKQINECARLVSPGGYKRTASIDGIGETENMKLIMDTLQNNPSKIKAFDCTEFILAMTADEHGALNPDSGIKFFEFNTVEPEKWVAYQAKENALFEKIKQDIQEHQK